MESIELVELDVESAVVELESTHVRMGPGFISILGVFVRFFDGILVFVRGDGGLEKK